MSKSDTRTIRIHKDLLEDIELHRMRKHNGSIPFVYASKTYLEDKRKLEEEHNRLMQRLGDNMFSGVGSQSKRGSTRLL